MMRHGLKLLLQREIQFHLVQTEQLIQDQERHRPIKPQRPQQRQFDDHRIVDHPTVLERQTAQTIIPRRELGGLDAGALLQRQRIQRPAVGEQYVEQVLGYAYPRHGQLPEINEPGEGSRTEGGGGEFQRAEVLVLVEEARELEHLHAVVGQLLEPRPVEEAEVHVTDCCGKPTFTINGEAEPVDDVGVVGEEGVAHADAEGVDLVVGVGADEEAGEVDEPGLAGGLDGSGEPALVGFEERTAGAVLGEVVLVEVEPEDAGPEEAPPFPEEGGTDGEVEGEEGDDDDEDFVREGAEAVEGAGHCCCRDIRGRHGRRRRWRKRSRGFGRERNLGFGGVLLARGGENGRN
ncbi:hypothetical protein H6P81_017558 [Aristolochia fimbriata]|uniref:Uncharacterized protein n=1 Tax=Aristolochia fimbriata TaxID=158543 RepID=A0AAV7DZJ8_ARIFI|nr:hypothetical protein H6P81_017558 [Aristolochia fimbriata]